jgi:ABC-type nitrate/sulfonate/bicarbonate transport system permease component
MLPYLMNGLRLGLILAVHAVLLSEMYAAPNGLGRQIFLWAEAYKTEPMLAGVLLVAICTITLNEALRAVEHRLGRWRMLSILR